MLDLGYVLFFVGLIVLFYLAPRKEFPLIVLVHGLVQYLFTMLGWYTSIDHRGVGILLMGLVVSTLCLFWGMSLAEREAMYPIRLFFSMTAWTILLILAVFSWVKSPYDYGYLLTGTSAVRSEGIRAYLSLHPLIKVGGNLLIFITFLQLALYWRQSWSARKSLLDLLPAGLYVLLVVGYWASQRDLSALPLT